MQKDLQVLNLFVMGILKVITSIFKIKTQRKLKENPI